jgi:AsmA protein
MSKTIKTISILVSVSIALAFAAILLLPQLLNTDTFKQQLTQQVERHTGRSLTITGDVKLSLFPWLSVHIGALSLSQPAGITPKNTPFDKPLLQIASAKIGVKLFSLLKNKFQFSKIELNQPQLHFIMTKDGSTSLTGITNNKSSQIKPSINSLRIPSTTKSFPRSDKASTLAAIAISGVSIINGELIIEDQAKQTLYKLTELNIEATDLLSLNLTPVKITALVSVNSNTDRGALDFETFKIELQSQVSYSAELLAVTLQQVTASIAEISNSQSTRTLNATLNKLSFSQKTQVLDIEQLNLAVNNGQLSPELSIASAAVTLDGSLNNYTTPMIAFKLAEKTLALKASGEISVKDWNKEPLIKGHIASDIFSPKKIINILKIDYEATDKKALNISKFSSGFNASTHGLALHNIKLTLDDSYLEGDLSLMNFQDPHYMFDLDLDQINVDRYTPKSDDPSSEASSKKSSQQNAAAGLAIIAPLPLFKNISANGVFRTTNLQASGAQLSNIVVDVKSKNKEVIIKPKANLYDGEMHGTITFRDTGDESTLRIENNLQNVNFGSLLKDTNVTEKITGQGSAKTDLLFIEKNGQQTNTGTSVLTLLNGALKDIDIKKILDDAQNNIDALRGKTIKQATAEESETSFAQINATLHLKNNVITNNDLSIKAPAFRIGGKGEINLTPQTLDYVTSITVVNTNEGQGGKNRSDLKGLSIPVRFYGPLKSPQYKIDFRALLKENSKRELAAEKDKLLLNAAEKLGLTVKGGEGSGDKAESSQKDLEKKLKEKVIDELFKKLF